MTSVTTRILARDDGWKLLERLALDRADAWPRFAQGEPITETSRGFVRRFRTDDGAGFYFKYYRPGAFWKRLAPTMTWSRPLNEFTALTFLREHGIDAVEPVGAGCSRRLGLLSGGFVLTREAEGMETLEQWVPRLGLSPAAADVLRRRNAARDLGALVARMHALQFFAHDLYFRNVLAAPIESPRPSLRFTFLDFPRGRSVAGIGATHALRLAAYDLAALDKQAPAFLSRTDRLRAIEGYLGRRPEARDLTLLDLTDSIRTRQLAKRAARLARRSRLSGR